MSNPYGICDRDERAIRARDKKCVYCSVRVKRRPNNRALEATIEHFNNHGPMRKRYNLAICCRGCNSSKGKKGLLEWFKTDYCKENRRRPINERTVCEPVKKYLRAVRRRRKRANT